MATATKYLLPCSCGQNLPIDISQAGQQVVCSCGQTMEVPPMRVIRTLAQEEPVPGTAQQRRAPAPWSPLQGGLFVSGFVIALVGLLAAAYCGWILSQIDASPPPPEYEAEMAEAFNKLPVNTMYEDVYLRVKSEGIGERIPPVHIQLQQLADSFTQYLIAALVVAGVGVAVAGSSFIVQGRS